MNKRPIPLRSRILCRGLQHNHFYPTKRAAKERAKSASERRRQLVEWLRKKWHQSTEAQSLAETLDACGRRHRCLSGACPECSQAAQNLVVELLRAFVRSRPPNEKIAIISIAQDTSAVPLGQLRQFSAANFVRRLKYALAEADPDWVIGGIDYSQNEHATDRYEPFWLPHFFGILATSDLKLLRKRLTKVFLKSDAIPKPALTKSWDGRQRAFRYALKTTFWRRVGEDNVDRFDPNAGFCRNTRKQRLRSAERHELLLHLDAIGLDARLVMFRTQLRRMRDGPVITTVPASRRKPKIPQDPKNRPKDEARATKKQSKRASSSQK